MLESATIRNPGSQNGRVDVGRILDTLLYYERVHLIMDPTLLSAITQQIGANCAQDLLSYPSLTSEIVPDLVGIHTDPQPALPLYRAAVFRHAGREGARISPSDIIGSVAYQFKNVEGLEDLSRRDVERLTTRSRKRNLNDIIGGQAGAMRLFLSMSTDADTLKMFLRQIARQRGVPYSEARLIAAKIIVTDPSGPEQAISVLSDPHINAICDVNVDDPITWATVLTEVFSYSIDAYISQSTSTDLVCPPEIGELADKRIDLSLMRATSSKNKISAFEEQFFGGANRLGDAITSGRVSIREGLKLIDRTRRFRTWTASLAHNASLIEEYHAKMSEDSLASKLPSKTVRFAIFTGGGLAASMVAPPAFSIPASLALAAFDNFVVDKLRLGWRPNAFTGAVLATLEAAR